MFYGASSFNQDLNKWDVSRVSYFQGESAGAWIYGMFEGASSFNQELNTWDVSSMTALTGSSSSFAAFFKPPKPICWLSWQQQMPPSSSGIYSHFL
jgi:surface protein